MLHTHAAINKLLLPLMLLAACSAMAQATHTADTAGACSKTGKKAMAALPALYAAKDTAGITMQLEQWHSACSTGEPLFSFSMLYAIKRRELPQFLTAEHITAGVTDSTLADTAVINHIYPLLVSYKAACRSYTQGTPYGNDIAKEKKQYYLMLRSMARKLLKDPTLSPLQQFLVTWYADVDNTLYNPATGQVAHEKHTRTKRDATALPVGGAELFITAGHFTPIGHLSAIGDHYTIGGIAGVKLGEVTLDLDVSAYLTGNASNSINITHNDTTYRARPVGGAIVGLGLGYDVLNRNEHMLEITGFVGVMGIEPQQPEYPASGGYQPSGISLPEIRSMDIGLGLGYRVYTRTIARHNMFKYGFVSLQARYDQLFFNNSQGTNLSGGAFNIRLQLGFINYSYRNCRQIDD